jgi:hypothetical protein
VGHRQSSSAIRPRRIALRPFGLFDLPWRTAYADVGESALAKFYSSSARRTPGDATHRGDPLTRATMLMRGATSAAASAHTHARRMDCQVKLGNDAPRSATQLHRNFVPPTLARHCEERSDEAIQNRPIGLDSLASRAMTLFGAGGNSCTSGVNAF